MTIGIDARSLIGKRAGVGRYLYNLLKGLSAIDKENQYVLYFHEEVKERVVDRPNFNQRIIYLPILQNYFTWTHFRLPPELLAHRTDIFHFPFYTMPLLVSCPSVVTIYDITFHLHPEWFSLKGKVAQTPFCRLAARHVDRIITCSETSKNDIQRAYSVPDDKIEVVYPAAGPEFAVMSRREARGLIGAKYGIKDKFFLYVGTIHIRRNIERLVRAFKLFLAKRPDHRLVLVGKVEWPYLDVKGLIEGLGLSGRVMHLGYVDDNVLPLIYNAAEVFLYPSLYEGFGLPVLEAMACGTPVIASRNSALRELFSDSALLIDPHSVEAMGDAMTLLSEDRGLREELVSKGLEKVKRFSWEEAAEKTLQVYRQIGGK